MTALTDRFRAAVVAIPDPPAGPIADVTEAQMFSYVDRVMETVEVALGIAEEMAVELDKESS